MLNDLLKENDFLKSAIVASNNRILALMTENNQLKDRLIEELKRGTAEIEEKNFNEHKQLYEENLKNRTITIFWHKEYSLIPPIWNRNKHIKRVFIEISSDTLFWRIHDEYIEIYGTDNKPELYKYVKPEIRHKPLFVVENDTEKDNKKVGEN